MGWIKFDKDMANDPRLIQSATLLLDTYTIARRTPGGGIDLSDGDALRVTSNALRGALVTLWCYADEHIRNDDRLPCDARAIDALVGIDGFCEVMPDEWLAVSDDGNVTLPGYCEKNGLISRKKKANRAAERQKRYREKQKTSPQRDVTHNGGRNGLRDIGVTQGGDQDKDLDQDLNKEKQEKSASPPLRVVDSPDVEKVFQHWQQVHDHHGARLDDKRRKVIRAALKLYSADDLCLSISGYRNSEFHMGKNESGMHHDSIQLLLRDADHIDRGLALARQGRRIKWEG